MSTKKNAFITSYFKPKNGEHGEATSKAPEQDASENLLTTASSTLQDKDNGKIKKPSSASPEPLSSKGQDNEVTAPKALSYKNLPPTHYSPPSSSSLPTLSLTPHAGSLFSAPPGTLLLHACNTQGSWGAGIALAFKQQYPNAYTIYNAFCAKEHSIKAFNPVPVGTTLLIPPVDGDKGHWIGCLFTSRRYGKQKDDVKEILRNTKRAVEVCLELVKVVGDEISGIRMCRINSGKFGVPWKNTEEVLKAVLVREGWVGSVEVWNEDDF
ncbi:hypothetical protein yc1106_03408 [Curvularia clavata]|uniref:ADP-ribose 1''-phosphate phosphatase n=1 Tax=Curvularia clavata TaxID=95742 RepID=A0A9Q9DRW7_CURCL|nr:hypothetical protein yc1106_03408 [Curvularia clavata]